ncbi:MAG: hypothetical protein KDA66_07845 [Planctomycetaceae bacterium]|nr:hypothetical protein [Planctomycetaceae bacterium]
MPQLGLPRAVLLTLLSVTLLTGCRGEKSERSGSADDDLTWRERAAAIDPEFVDDEAAPRTAAEDFKQFATANWSAIPYYSSDSELPDPPPLEVILQVDPSGQSPIVGTSPPLVDVAVANGRPLKTLVDPNAAFALSDLTLIDRTLPFLPHPERGAAISLLFRHPVELPSSIDELRGSVPVVVSHAQEDFTNLAIRQLLELIEWSPALHYADCKLTMAPATNSNGATCQITTGSTAILSNLQVVNGNGQNSTSVWSAPFISSDGRLGFEIFNNDGDVTLDTRLTFTLHSKLEQVDIPFEFTNLAVPDFTDAAVRSQLGQVTWYPSTIPIAESSQLSIEAKPRWVAPELEDESSSSKQLALDVELRGPLLEQLFALGELRLNNSRTNCDELAKAPRLFDDLTDQLAGRDDVSGEFDLYSQNQRLLRLNLLFDAPPECATEIENVVGNVTIITAREMERITLPRALATENADLEHDQLKAAGIQLKVHRVPNLLLVVAVGGSPDRIGRARTITPDGHRVGAPVYAPSFVPSAAEYAIPILKEGSEDVVLELELPVGLERHIVPFRFEHVPIPPRD